MEKPETHEGDLKGAPSPGALGDLTRAAEEPEAGILREFFAFLRHNKKWWLIPILVALILLGALIFLGGTVLAPFLYPLF